MYCFTILEVTVYQRSRCQKGSAPAPQSLPLSPHGLLPVSPLSSDLPFMKHANETALETHNTPITTYFNLSTSTMTMFPNKVTFWGVPSSTCEFQGDRIEPITHISSTLRCVSWCSDCIFKRCGWGSTGRAWCGWLYLGKIQRKETAGGIF